MIRQGIGAARTSDWHVCPICASALCAAVFSLARLMTRTVIPLHPAWLALRVTDSTAITAVKVIKELKGEIDKVRFIVVCVARVTQARKDMTCYVSQWGIHVWGMMSSVAPALSRQEAALIGPSPVFAVFRA